jgi:hypothetical protein
MKKILLFILILSCAVAKAQYNNEWIDYNKTYYKFSVAQNSLNRITQAALQTAGLQNTPAEQFQLWRNGVQVPLYTSVTSGALGGSGYIEFWGEMNDGKPDINLYANINNQLSDKWSLETDTASYFLTVNGATSNTRLVDQVNNVAGNSLPAEPYFMYTAGQYFKNKINAGYAQIVTEYIYSSVYDKGEGYTSDDIYPSSPLNDVLPDLYPYAGGPNGTFFIAACGNAVNNRTFNAKVNGTKLVDVAMDVFSDQRQLVSMPVSLLSSGSANVQVTNVSTNPNDRMVVAKYELTYPRQFNFGSASNFAFELPATAIGNYLRITFSYGSTAPVLYDLTNLKRYTGVIDEAGIAKFALLPSAQKRKLVLMSQEAGNIVYPVSFTTRNFVDYALQANQATYIIISNPLLYNGANGNPVEAYRQYRSSAAGGSYTSKVYDIDQLTDQFAYGIIRSPLAIKKFLKYTRQVYTEKPQFVFLIGKGVNYVSARANESNVLLTQMNLVPSFGFPASDNLLASNDNETISAIPIGRLSAVNATEVQIYLDKIKEYESVRANSPQTMTGRSWMKNIVHAIGGGNAELSKEIGGYMNQLRTIAQDTSWGANVISFSKSSAIATQLTSDGLKKQFETGIGIVNYFGHSSASITEFNIDDPSIYQNQGKYPMFLVNGCLAGDIFNFESNRLAASSTLSEKYVFANQRGAIGFVASTHYGIVNYLNIYLHGLYGALSKTQYGQPIGQNLEESFRYLLNNNPGDYLARLHAEEMTLQGDPAVKLYMQNLPDYVVEDQMVVLPSSISISETNFTLSAKFINLGKAINDSVKIEVKRQLPDGTINTLLQKKIKGINFIDSVTILVPINPAIEKGENKIIVTIDVDNAVNEISESNNSVVKSFYIIDDGLKPIYPYNLSILNNSNISFYASTSAPLPSPRNYIMEIDTTELFNSNYKKSFTKNATTNVLEFKLSSPLIDSTVYYWRTAPVGNPDSIVWNSSSFLYLSSNINGGYAQAHYFQHLKSANDDIVLDNNRVFRYASKETQYRVRMGLYPAYTYDKVDISLNQDRVAQWMCEFNVIQFMVIDGITGKPWTNYNVTPSEARFGSRPLCNVPPTTFSFLIGDSSQRRKAMQMIDSIPDGNYVMIFWTGVSQDLSWINANRSFIDQWKSDTLHLGTNKSLYHALKNMGLDEIDKFTKNIPFLFMLKKGGTDYPISQFVGETDNDYIQQDFFLNTYLENGTIQSPWFGPAKEWEALRWNGKSIEQNNDKTSIELYGKGYDNNESLLKIIENSHDTSLLFVDSKKYPYLRLKMNNTDSITATPYQLAYWRLEGKLPPEGVIYPGVDFKFKDTLDAGEKIDLKIAFKNISLQAFDSLNISLKIIDKNNVSHDLMVPKGKALLSGDTVSLIYSIDSKSYPGLNTMFVYFNPDNDQPEQYTFNNFLYKNFYIKADTYNPLLDVTFDGVHILNDDIVSAKPHILIKLKDDSRFIALDDTALIKVQVKYPNGSLKVFAFNTDTLKFTPADLTNNKTDNTATIDFNPSFLEDGDYELIVSGRDKSGNTAGQSNYSVSFKVVNKPMISNMFNYPNPFTTSTAFVFTLTGSEVPRNLRIQILTITGKIVKEITKEELGPIRIGRNITEFKWDGTDMYGQKLANGVYLYRVISNLNGKSLEKYKTEGDNTDQYFNKGYGKMYLMR